MSKETQQAMKTEQRNKAQAVNAYKSNNYYLTVSQVAQTVLNGATASGRDVEIISETSSAKERREERMKKFHIELEVRLPLKCTGTV